MDDYRVPTDEQETVIQFDRNGTVCHVYTTDTTVMTKLDKIHKHVKQDYVNESPLRHTMSSTRNSLHLGQKSLSLSIQMNNVRHCLVG